MSKIPSSSNTSELGANSVHRTAHRTSPELSERHELVRRGSRHVYYHRAPTKFKVRDGWAVIWATGKTPLVFVDEGVKIDQNVYRRDILDATVVSCARCHFGRQQWTLQHVSAPAHRAGLVQGQFFRLHHICGMAALLVVYRPHGLQHLVNFADHVRAKNRKNLEALKQSLQQGWDRLSAEELRRTALNFRTRLTLCM